jgi:hypothetical protein
MIQVQYITESSSVCSTVFCFFQEKERKEEKKKDKREKWLATFPKADRQYVVTLSVLTDFCLKYACLI